MQAEEALWTELIDTYSGMKADWVPDVVGMRSFYGTQSCCASVLGSGEWHCSGSQVSGHVKHRMAEPAGRALGNRGNSRSRQGRLDEALADFNAAIALCPWAVDPVLNRRGPPRAAC